MQLDRNMQNENEKCKVKIPAFIFIGNKVCKWEKLCKA